MASLVVDRGGPTPAADVTGREANLPRVRSVVEASDLHLASGGGRQAHRQADLLPRIRIAGAAPTKGALENPVPRHLECRAGSSLTERRHRPGHRGASAKAPNSDHTHEPGNQWFGPSQVVSPRCVILRDPACRDRRGVFGERAFAETSSLDS